jgi:outer membrane lipoprotein LolB
VSAATSHARLLAGMATMLLSACATAPPPLEGLISGRLAVQVAASAAEPARQLSGSFELRGNATRGQLDLVSPIGITVAQARWTPARVELMSNEGPVVFASLDDLSERTFGEPLPLAALFDWLRGRPWPGAASRPQARGFEQLGWDVDTSRLAEGQIEARRAAPPTVTLRARLESPS